MNTTPRLFGLIPAAGSGTRIGGEIPKQYVAIGARSVLEHSIAALAGDARIDEIVVVVAPDDMRHKALPPAPRVRYAAVGGASRAESVRNGLRAIDAAADDWILVHDAARPCLSPAEIARLIDTVAGDAVGGLLALPLADTLKRARDSRVDATVARESLWRAQTPQMFRYGVLLRALESASDDPAAVTDESGAVEQCGGHPRVVMGAATNIKVTTNEDWPLAAAILRAQGRIE